MPDEELEPEQYVNAELHELIAAMNLENAAMLAREDAVLAAVARLKRLTAAKLRVLEELTTTLTGIRSDGTDA